MNEDILIKIVISSTFLFLFSSLVTCDLIDENLLFNFNEQMLAFPNLDQDNVTDECRNQYISLRDHEPDTLSRMYDAWSKLYPGLFYATKSDFGSYDECISIDVTIRNKTKSKQNERILGKYCAGMFMLIPKDSVLLQLQLAYCIPEACNGRDLNVTVKNENLSLPIFTDLYCSTKETNTELDSGAIASLSIFGIFILIVIISTIYDVFLNWEGNKSPNPLLTAFSFYTNGKKLFSVSKLSNAQIQCFNGMKFIGMWWIIAGHSALGWGEMPVVNGEFQTTWIKSRRSLYITRAYLGVDTFFFVSGFLLAYSYFKRKAVPIKTQIFQIPVMIRHRYLRLTPAVVMTYLFTVFLLKYCGDGPVWSSQTKGGTCQKYWWSTFLYIQNYTNRNEICIATLWYLCVDFQLFVLAPIFFIPISTLYKKSLKLALAGLLGLNAFFFVLPIFTKLMWRDYDPNFDEFDTHSRFIDYYIGVAMGLYMIAKKPQPHKIPMYLNILAWLTVLAVMSATLIFSEDAAIYYGYVARSLAQSIIRPVWCLGLCWITYACVTGNGGIINWILSNGFMQVGGKLTYCMYLVHFPLIAIYLYRDRIRWYYSDYNFFYLWCGHFICSLMVGIFWYLTFEQPLVIVERVLFGPRPKKPIKTDPNSAGETKAGIGKEDIEKIS